METSVQVLTIFCNNLVVHSVVQIKDVTLFTQLFYQPLHLYKFIKFTH